MATASQQDWRLRPVDPAIVDGIAAATSLSPVMARVLAARGVAPNVAIDHLQPSLRKSLVDPSGLDGMDALAKRLAAAVRDGETIGIFGDYDVDGTTAAAILALYFRRIGAAFAVHLPDRLTEGYGPSVGAMEQLQARGASVVVTVDCGAAAHDVVDAASDLGLDMVVIDHHLMDDEGPAKAIAVVNPQKPSDASGLTNLSAAGLAFMAVVALNRSLRNAGYFAAATPEPDLKSFLDLAGLGLVCDVMSMTGLARVIVAQGLKALAAPIGNLGLKALADAAGAKTPYSSYTFGFQLGPRINAAGRVGHAQQAFELLTTEDPDRRIELANRLHEMNASRQAIESQVQTEAIAQIETSGRRDDPVIVVAGEGWHPGVVGIVAGRLKDKYARPTLVIGLDNGVGKGSGRSLSGVDLGGAIVAARQAGVLVAGGGHEMAAGLTVDADKIDALRDFLAPRLAPFVHAAINNRRRSIDAVIAASSVSRRFVDDIAQAGPFGPDNPEPIFVIRDLSIASVRPVGVNHLSVNFIDGGGQSVRAIAFRAIGERLGDILSNAPAVHVAGRVSADDWRGGDAAQLQIVDAMPAE